MIEYSKIRRSEKYGKWRRTTRSKRHLNILFVLSISSCSRANWFLCQNVVYGHGPSFKSASIKERLTYQLIYLFNTFVFLDGTWVDTRACLIKLHGSRSPQNTFYRSRSLISVAHLIQICNLPSTNPVLMIGRYDPIKWLSGGELHGNGPRLPQDGSVLASGTGQRLCVNQKPNQWTQPFDRWLMWHSEMVSSNSSQNLPICVPWNSFSSWISEKFKKRKLNHSNFSRLPSNDCTNNIEIATCLSWIIWFEPFTQRGASRNASIMGKICIFWVQPWSQMRVVRKIDLWSKLVMHWCIFLYFCSYTH